MAGVYAKLVDLFQDTSTASLSRGEMPVWRGLALATRKFPPLDDCVNTGEV